MERKEQLARLYQSHMNAVHRDPSLVKSLDDAKRTAIYTPGLNRVNEKAFILPISEMPMLWAHSKDLKVSENTLSASSPVLGDFSWK